MKQCGSCENIWEYNLTKKESIIRSISYLQKDEAEKCPICYSGNWVFGSINYGDVKE